MIVKFCCSILDFSFFVFSFFPPFFWFCFLLYRHPSAVIEDSGQMLQSSALTVRSLFTPLFSSPHIYCHGSLLHEPKTCFKTRLSCDAVLRGIISATEVMLMNSVKPDHISLVIFVIKMFLTFLEITAAQMRAWNKPHQCYGMYILLQGFSDLLFNSLHLIFDRDQ